MRPLLITALFLTGAAFSANAYAAQATATTAAKAKPAAVRCHDAKGKFIACPVVTPAKAKQCRDAKGKFIKC
jgi:hypothetical protein